MKSHESRGRKNGMTLIEVMIATGILLMTMGGAFYGLLQARYLSRLTAHRALAIQIARANIEALRSSSGYNDDQLNVGEHADIEKMPAVIAQIFSINGKVVYVDYKPKYQVSLVDLGGVTYKVVAFRVDWTENTVSGQRNHFIEANTMIASALNR